MLRHYIKKVNKYPHFKECFIVNIPGYGTRIQGVSARADNL